MTLIESSSILSPLPGAVSLHTAAVHLHSQDDVAIARGFLHPGTVILLDAALGGVQVVLGAPISAGHKFALHPIAAGQPVRRYGHVIGFASQPIQAGDHVHTHNLSVRDYERESAFGIEAHPVKFIPPKEVRRFMGYLRPDGRVGTRNIIAIIATVNCAAD